MGAVVARGKLIGIRFSDEEYERIERLIAHYERLTPGVPFNAQTVIKASLALAERELGIAPPAPPSRPRPKTATKKR
ncbi:MAG: hypothetical protein JST00_30200 [Deltaproteobacteria bacterium]|nr:hypothetical protein [Deltaproteobacteria bacterium]